MRRLALVLVAACGFRHGHAPVDAVDTPVAPPADATWDGQDIDAVPIDAPPPPIELRQINTVFGTGLGVVAVPFTTAQLAGDLNVVVVGWYRAGSVTSISDVSGNTYAVATGPAASGAETQTTYYSCGIAAAAMGANIVTVTFSGSGQDPDVHVAEYSGIRPAGCLDVASSSTGSGTAMDGGPLVTTNARDLLFAATFQLYQVTAGDPAYTSRGINSFGDLVEDQVVSATGTYHANATQNTAATWVMQLVAFDGL